MSRLMLALTAIVLFPTMSFGAETGFRYHSSPQLAPEGRYQVVDSSILVEFEGKQVKALTGDSWVGGEVCSRGAWKCLKIPFLFNFAINSEWKRFPKEWKFGQIDYRYYGEQTIRIFGREAKTHFICAAGGKSTSPVRDACFSYSYDYGLLAIYLYDDGFDGDTVTAYYSASEYGLFGMK